MEQPTTPEPPRSQTVQILAMSFGFATTVLCLVLMALEAKLGFGEGTHAQLVAAAGGGTLMGGVGAFLFQRK